MNKWLHRIKTWHSGRQAHALEHWEKIQAKGKFRFVSRVAIIWTLAMMAIAVFADYQYDGALDVSKLRFRIVSYTIGGVLMGLFAWWQRDSQYKNARIQNRL